MSKFNSMAEALSNFGVISGAAAEQEAARIERRERREAYERRKAERSERTMRKEARQASRTREAYERRQTVPKVDKLMKRNGRWASRSTGRYVAHAEVAREFGQDIK